jgi:hypothetical protein
MNWFGQNRWLGTFLVVFGIATMGALYFLFSAKSSSNEALTKFQEAVTEKSRLERLDPFPSEANHRKMKMHLENYTAALNRLKEELKARVPNPPPLAPNEFQTRLRQAMLAVSEKARANRVKLPDNFALGFEQYTTGLPNTGVAPLLGQELTQIEALLNLLIDAHVDGISTFSRKPLTDERGAAGATPAPSPGRGAKPNTPEGPQLIDRGTVEVSFSSAPSAARKVLNQVVSSPQQFYIVRLLHVRNEKDKGPAREQPGQTQPGAAATVQPTPAKPAGGAGLTFIVGNEHIDMSARIELLQFNFQ